MDEDTKQFLKQTAMQLGSILISVLLTRALKSSKLLREAVPNKTVEEPVSKSLPPLEEGC
jgi:hypothetical protein